MAHVSDAKKKELSLLKELIARNPHIGIIDVTGLPSLQLQKLKAQLKDTLLIRITKKRLIQLALDQSKEVKKGVEGLQMHLTNVMPGILATKEDVFKLSKVLGKNKSSALAKAGQVAPYDIIIPAGPTPFAPGPVIGELGQMGMKTGVEGGKIVIKEDKLLVKQGETIQAKQADLMAKLSIEPMEIGLNLVAIFDGKQIYAGDVLKVDEALYIENLQTASREAMNLALTSAYVTPDTITLLVSKAFNEARSLSTTAKVDVATEVVQPQKEDVTKEVQLEEKKPEPKEEKQTSEPVGVEVLDAADVKEEIIVTKPKGLFKDEDMAKAKQTLEEWTDEKIKKEEMLKKQGKKS